MGEFIRPLIIPRKSVYPCAKATTCMNDLSLNNVIQQEQAVLQTMSNVPY